MKQLTDGAVESWGSAAAETIPSKNFNGLLLDNLVPSQSGKIVAGKIGDNLSSALNFGFGTGGTNNDRDRRKVVRVGFVKLVNQRFRNPFVYQLVDFLWYST